MNENASLEVYIPLSVCAFVFGIMEGVIELWRA
jgi:hypothetical protein